MDKVWVVTVNSVMNYEEINDVMLFESFEDAKKCFDKKVNRDKTEYFDGYEDNDSYLYQECENYWCIWENGCSQSCHSEVQIQHLAIIKQGEYEEWQY